MDRKGAEEMIAREKVRGRFPSSMDFEPTDHRGFNAFVQRVQAECRSWRMEHRMRATGGMSYFEVFWDDWHVLASEVPFTPDGRRQGQIAEGYWAEIQADMALSAGTS